MLPQVQHHDAVLAWYPRATPTVRLSDRETAAVPHRKSPHREIETHEKHFGSYQAEFVLFYAWQLEINA